MPDASPSPSPSPSPSRPWSLRPPRIRSVLLAVHLLILALPLAGISLLRLYSTTLARQTESELVIQGAMLAASYRAELERLAPTFGVDLETFGIRLGTWAPASSTSPDDARFDPALPELDLARQRILPPEPLGRLPSTPAAPLARAAGEALERLLRETQRVSLAGIRVVDANGVVVASSRGGLGHSVRGRSEVERALEGQRAVVVRQRSLDGPRPAIGSISRDANVRVVVGYPVLGPEGTAARGAAAMSAAAMGSGPMGSEAISQDAEQRLWGAIILGRTPLSARQALWRDRRHLFVGSMVLLGIVGLVTLLVSTTITRPLDRLIAQTARVERGETHATSPLARPGTREVERISHAVARLSGVLQRRAEYIATFAAGLSHELKTPLTSLQGSVELLRDHLESMSTEELDRFLTMLEKDARRIERLVDRLLDLARADVIRPGDATSSVAAVARRIASRFASDARIIHWSEKALDGLVVTVGEDALDTILSNLLDNAFIHGALADRVDARDARTDRAADCGVGPRVQLTASRLADEVLIDVTDQGPGISETIRARLFQRFATTRPNEGGTGLGLAIVKSLVCAHGGAVSVHDRDDGEPGTVFRVRLPSPDYS